MWTYFREKIKKPLQARCSAAQPAAAARDGGTPTTYPTGTPGRVEVPRHCSSPGIGVVRRDDLADSSPARLAEVEAACRQWPRRCLTSIRHSQAKSRHFMTRVFQGSAGRIRCPVGDSGARGPSRLRIPAHEGSRLRRQKPHGASFQEKVEAKTLREAIRSADSETPALDKGSIRRLKDELCRRELLRNLRR